MQSPFAAVLSAALILLLSARVASPETYYRVDVLTPFNYTDPFTHVTGPGAAVAREVNASGRVVGWATSNSIPGSYGDSGRFEVGLAPIGVGHIPNVAQSSANAVNASGIVAGSAYYYDAGNSAYRYRGFYDRVDGGAPTVIQPFAGGANSQGFGLNDSGMVVGASDTNATATAFSAFWWTQTSGIHALPAPSGYFSQADAVNNSGVIVGYTSATQYGDRRAAVWQDTGGGYARVDIPLAPGMVCAAATDISDQGVVIGWTYNSGLTETATFRWTAAEGVTLLPMSYYSAHDINSSGAIVGESTPFTSQGGYGWIYRGGQVVNLNTVLAPSTPAGAYVNEAWGVNDAGQIAATVLLNYDPATGFGTLEQVALLTPLRPGDANGDGKIDGGDLAVWQQNYDPLGTQGDNNTFWKGDWNGDHKIDGGDLALWQQNYAPLGYSSLSGPVPLGGTGATDAVPEPATTALVLAGLVAARLARRKR